MADEQILFLLTSPPMKDGEKGIEGIAALQKTLASKDFLPEGSDAPENPGKQDGKGVYGPETADAVKRRKFWIGYPADKCSGHMAGDQFRDYMSGERKPTPAMNAMRRKRLQ